MNDVRKVTEAWGRIHQRHPTAYQPRYVKQIKRLGHRDFAKLIHEYCNIPQGSLILEPGCGSGRDSLYFSSLHYRTVALDYHFLPLSLLQLAVRLLPNDSLQIVAGDLFGLPFPENRFDLVFNSGVLEHYGSESVRSAVLHEMVRVTKPGGHVAVLIPNCFHVLDGWWSVLVTRFSDHDEYDIPEQRISAQQLSKELESVGLSIELAEPIDAYDTISHYPFWLPLRATSYVASRVLPRPSQRIREKWGTRIMVVGRKN